MTSWILDLTFEEKSERVRKKARECSISELEAFKLCVVEYETGVQLNKVTVQTENAYNQYKLEGNRPNSVADYEHKVKIREELQASIAAALLKRRALAQAAGKSVETRIDVKHGAGTYAALGEEKEGLFGFLEWKPKMPTIDVKMPSFKLGGTAKLVGGLVVLLVVGVVLLVAIGYSGMGESVGRIGEGEYKRKVK